MLRKHAPRRKTDSACDNAAAGSLALRRRRADWARYEPAREAKLAGDDQVAEPSGAAGGVVTIVVTLMSLGLGLVVSTAMATLGIIGLLTVGEL